MKRFSAGSILEIRTGKSSDQCYIQGLIPHIKPLLPAFKFLQIPRKQQNQPESEINVDVSMQGQVESASAIHLMLQPTGHTATFWVNAECQASHWAATEADIRLGCMIWKMLITWNANITSWNAGMVRKLCSVINHRMQWELKSIGHSLCISSMLLHQTHQNSAKSSRYQLGMWVLKPQNHCSGQWK